MKMAKRQIVETFRGREDLAWYEVEYLDTQGQWISAAGGWKDGETVMAQYPDRDGARLAAVSLRKTHSYQTRYVRVSE